ncbi:hypothetical protein [Actinomadura chibensis]|uniref:hypothetical protein n=1 Tax=Actinomadura chibensis TaxID=392828 RepID=UPI000AAFA5AD|nr:hypothetical protein [Actinomadura chibensis]
MSNSTRWTVVGILIAVNAVANVVLGDTWFAIAVSSVTGVGVVAVLIDYLARGRREP